NFEEVCYLFGCRARLRVVIAERRRLSDCCLSVAVRGGNDQILGCLLPHFEFKRAHVVEKFVKLGELHARLVRLDPLATDINRLAREHEREKILWYLEMRQVDRPTDDECSPDDKAEGERLQTGDIEFAVAQYESLAFRSTTGKSRYLLRQPMECLQTSEVRI